MSDFVTPRDLDDPYREVESQKIVGHCEYCEGEIFDTQEYYELNGFERVHAECFCDYMMDKYECCLVYPM